MDREIAKQIISELQHIKNMRDLGFPTFSVPRKPGEIPHEYESTHATH